MAGHYGGNGPKHKSQLSLSNNPSVPMGSHKKNSITLKLYGSRVEVTQDDHITDEEICDQLNRDHDQNPKSIMKLQVYLKPECKTEKTPLSRSKLNSGISQFENPLSESNLRKSMTSKKSGSQYDRFLSEANMNSGTQPQSRNQSCECKKSRDSRRSQMTTTKTPGDQETINNYGMIEDGNGFSSREPIGLIEPVGSIGSIGEFSTTGSNRTMGSMTAVKSKVSLGVLQDQDGYNNDLMPEDTAIPSRESRTQSRTQYDRSGSSKLVPPFRNNYCECKKSKISRMTTSLGDREALNNFGMKEDGWSSRVGIGSMNSTGPIGSMDSTVPIGSMGSMGSMVTTGSMGTMRSTTAMKSMGSLSSRRSTKVPNQEEWNNFNSVGDDASWNPRGLSMDSRKSRISENQQPRGQSVYTVGDIFKNEDEDDDYKKWQWALPRTSEIPDHDSRRRSSSSSVGRSDTSIVRVGKENSKLLRSPVSCWKWRNNDNIPKLNYFPPYLTTQIQKAIQDRYKKGKPFCFRCGLQAKSNTSIEFKHQLERNKTYISTINCPQNKINKHDKSSNLNYMEDLIENTEETSKKKVSDANWSPRGPSPMSENQHPQESGAFVPKNRQGQSVYSVGDISKTEGKDGNYNMRQWALSRTLEIPDHDISPGENSRRSQPKSSSSSVGRSDISLVGIEKENNTLSRSPESCWKWRHNDNIPILNLFSPYPNTQIKKAIQDRYEKGKPYCFRCGLQAKSNTSSEFKHQLERNQAHVSTINCPQNEINKHDKSSSFNYMEDLIEDAEEANKKEVIEVSMNTDNDIQRTEHHEDKQLDTTELTLSAHPKLKWKHDKSSSFNYMEDLIEDAEEANKKEVIEVSMNTDNDIQRTAHHEDKQLDTTKLTLSAHPEKKWKNIFKIFKPSKRGVDFKNK